MFTHVADTFIAVIFASYLGGGALLTLFVRLGWVLFVVFVNEQSPKDKTRVRW